MRDPAWFASTPLVVTVSAAAHALLLLALVTLPTRSPGADGTIVDAIGVELVESTALDAMFQREVPDGQAIAKPSEAPAHVAPAVPVPDTGDEPVPRAEASHQPAVATPPAIVGGAAATGVGEDDRSVRSAAANGRAAARYALTVREAIARVQPRHQGATGKVEVAFGLAPTGALRFAEVTHTSGNGRLDEAALKAVHTAAFPTPPAGLSERQLSFVVPFNFR